MCQSKCWATNRTDSHLHTRFLYKKFKNSFNSPVHQFINCPNNQKVMTTFLTPSFTLPKKDEHHKFSSPYSQLLQPTA